MPLGKFGEQNFSLSSPLLASVEFSSHDPGTIWSPAPAAMPRPGTSPPTASSHPQVAPCETQAGRSGQAK